MSTNPEINRTDLTGKVALVTGGTRGIGRATAQHLARAGAKICVSYVRNHDAAQKTVRDIEAAGGTAFAICSDVRRVDHCTRLFDEVIERFGGLDIAVLNAGYSAFSPLAETTEAAFDEMFAVNTKGTFFCLQHAANAIAENGRIVCVSTIGTILNLPGGACYFASKAAVEQFCRVLARELAPRGVTVNTISPGFTDTDMLVETGGATPDMASQIIEMTPLARLGQPDDIARVIGFLVSDEAGWINRQNIAADGGIISR